ncbi:MAG: isoleucine--tRNA ligase [Gammaproteobacteria bacterium RBG_16_37_9]|nr:MAG: isoleucine--tRNA ligase [Gammaproteobacteria bacterium RBG_16_37_9]
MTTYNVNLPQTSFPMKADLPKREPKMLEFWQTINLYQSFVSPKNARGKFIVHDGPPYANGDIHLGHAFNKILKDIINKTKLLEGYSVPYVPGWDCHGLPSELNVEKKIGKANVKVPVEKFITECRKYAAEQIQIQIKAFKRLGVIGDWENFYSTMDFKYEADIVRALLGIIEAGYVIRGYKPVHWCIACGSALAEAEVEYKDKVSPAIDVKFRVVNSDKFKVENLSIPIWTTTPWTLPANEAVCLHPKLKYALVHCITLNEHFIFAEDLLEQVMQRYGETEYRIEKVYVGEELQGLMLKHPFLDDKTVPVILGEHVTFDVGTGAVHTAPAHGQEDYKIGLHYKLPINNPVGSNGKFLSSTKFFAGLNVFDANEQVITVLKEFGNLIHAKTLEHSYPHCWRHKTPLIFRATQQWFVSMDFAPKHKPTLRQMGQDAIEKVNWIPIQGKNSIKSMIEQRPDWCISRQRFWGIPMTLFIHKESGEIHPQMQRLVNDVIAPNIEKNGLIYWYGVEPVSFLKEHAKDTDAESYDKVSDTLDVWFNSGVSHYCVLKQREELHFPADVYVEGSDQHRGWFQSSLLTSLALHKVAPYKTVVTHGFCVDAKGHKMSKSLGNVIDPKQVVDKYGADVLRLWSASSYLHDDLAVSEEILARTIDVYRILRNTARFLLGNLSDFNPKHDLMPSEKMLSLDRLAVAQILNLANNSRDHYNLYQFHVVCNNLQGLLTNDISSFYFSIIKDRLYTMSQASLGRRSAQTALFHILEILVRLIAPILSFTAEEIWQEMLVMDKTHEITSRAESVFMTRFSEIASGDDFDLSQDEITANDWSDIQNYRTAVNKELEKLRASNVIGSSLEAAVTLYCDDKVLSVLSKLKEDLRFVLITSAATAQHIASAPQDAIITGIAGLKLIALPSLHKKCVRCWHYREDVGSDKDHPELCARCADNLFGAGEMRYFA